ncbi:DUF3817 domain-containing protein [Nesterenkonia cremea]|uniref:DUF3817 domain-containing protein n=1 Tax=Nesterenkonia cremea TaxID=1882340 RepID=A0A917AQU8_9MICC|nr:DUF3817 domain-containing protein [Nesterenkonia cremea]GGE66047.1 hypothetical protein GCM10011401_11640 [Nesterenkonia cremea]
MTEPNTPRENADRAAEIPEAAAGGSETPLEEIDLGTPPPRPGRESRRFYGTPAQIRSALKFYRVMAFITGIFLLVMVAKILISGSLFGWVFWDGGQELYIGGTTATGEENIIGFFPAESLQDARSTSTLIAQAHGVAYIVYLVAGFRLWYMIRWGMGRLALIISGGLVPFFSFFVERKIVGFVKKDLESEPEAVPRY